MPIATLPSATTELDPIPLVIGDTWLFLVQLVNEEEDGNGVITETAFDLTADGGATYAGEIVNSAGTVVGTLTVGATDDPARPLTSGWLAVSAAPSVTSAIAAGRHRMRVRATWASFTPDYVITLLTGDVVAGTVW